MNIASLILQGMSAHHFATLSKWSPPHFKFWPVRPDVIRERWCIIPTRNCQEPMSRRMQLYYIPVTAFFRDRFIFRSNFPGMRLPWECHDQSQESNSLRQWTFTKGKVLWKMDQSIKMPWHRDLNAPTHQLLGLCNNYLEEGFLI